VLGDSALAGLFPLTFLASAPLHHMALADFHPEAVAVPALLWALCFLQEGRLLGLWGAVVVALACKETTALAVAGLGLVAILDRRRRWLGAALIAVGVGAFAAEVKLGLPFFAGHETPYTGRYSHLGNGMGEVLQAPLRHPLRVLSLLVFPARKIEGILRLLVPFAFLSAAAPATLVGALPNYLANAMAAYPPMHGVGFHYHAELMAFAAAAAVLGAARARARWSSRHLALALGLFSMLQIGKPEVALWWATPRTERHRQIDRLLESIPAEAAVSSDTRTATHLAHRRGLFHFPDRLGESDYVAVDSRVVDHAWHASPEQTRAAIASLPARGFEKLAEADGFFVFRRSSGR
jgi:uncharacterized membrane protein